MASIKRAIDSDLFIDQAGKIGIGDDTPSGKLTVVSTSTPQFVIGGSWSSNHDIIFAGGSYQSTGTALSTSARIRNVSSAPGGAATGDLLFTVNSGDTFVDALYIKEDGKVGIGTTSPLTYLQVYGTGIRSSVRIGGATATAGEGRIFIEYNEDSSYIDAYSNGAYNNLAIQAKNLTLNDISGGNVGIGTTSPAATLDIANSQPLLRLTNLEDKSWSSGQNISKIDFYTKDSSSPNGTKIAAYIQAINDVASSVPAGALAFGTSTGGGSSTNATEAVRISGHSGGLVGIGTTNPYTKLHVQGQATFGTPGNGSNTNGRFISIEGNTDSSGEGSSRIFFTEHNSTTAQMDSYGMSIGYRGGGTSITGPSGNTWLGLAQIGNGQWGMWGHDNNSTGSLIMYGDRAATFVSFQGLIYAASIGTGTDDSVVILDSDGTLRTDEIDSRVWGSSLVDGSGTANYVTKWSDANTLTNSILYDNGSVIGVGTTSPNFDIDIRRTKIGDSSRLRVRNDDGTNTGSDAYINIAAEGGDPFIQFDYGGATIYSIGIDNSDGDKFKISNGSSTYKPGDNDLVTVTSGGSVGIGTTAPNAKLRVHGTGDLSYIYNTGATAGDANFYVHNGSQDQFMIRNSGNIGIATASPVGLLHIKSLDPASDQILLNFRNPTYGIYIKTNSIPSRGNTVEFTATDYNNNSVVTRDVLTLRPEGSVGIGSTAPAASLDVNGNAIFRVSDSSTTTGGFTITNDGSSTTVASWAFNSNPIFLVTSDNAGNPHIGINQSSTDSNPAKIIGYKSRGTTVANSSVADGDEILQIQAWPLHTAGPNQYKFGGDMTWYKDDNGGTANTYAPVSLRWRLANSTTTVHTPMTLLYNGNLGIGTTAPNFHLQVDESTASTYVASFRNTNDNLQLKIGTTSGYMNLQTTTVNTDAVYAMSIQAQGGSVGIGTITPTATLQVNGNFRLYTTDTDGNELRGIFNVGGTADPLSLSMYKADAATVGTYLTADGASYFVGGNVGIGVTNPNLPFEVVRTGPSLSGTAYYSSRFLQDKTNYRGVFVGYDTAATTGIIGAETAGPASNLAFWTYFGGWGEKMRLIGNGNLGIGVTTPVAKLDVYQSGSTALNVAGSQGQLFSVTDSLSGSLMSVNDISGIPILEVFSSDRVVAGEFGLNTLVVDGGNVGIRQGTPNTTLHIGRSLAGDNTDYQIKLERHGTGASPGTWSDIPAIMIEDTSGDGPSSAPTYGLLDIRTGRVADGDTYSNNAHLIRATNDNGTAFVVTGKRRVGIGSTTSPAYALDVTGDIRATADVIAYSDARVKENVITLENSIDLIKKLRGVEYSKIGQSERKIGVIAQEILEVLPQVVSQDEAGMYSVAYGNLAGLFIEAIKQQQTHIETLEARIQKLEQLLTQKP